jgi:hypothetical protein
MMLWRPLVGSDAALAKVLGTAAGAVRAAERRGAIVRSPDGRWDVFDVLARWRRSSPRVGLRRSFRERAAALPWLDATRPLAPADWNALIRRAADVGATWQP